MKILFLGGTRFVGRHLVEAALERGHTPTIFHRGKTGASLFPGVERLIGDRDGGLAVLSGRRFDAVVDVNGYVPRVVGDAVDRLRDAVDRYLFVSTMSVYAHPEVPRQSESAALATIADPTIETVDAKTYGALKGLCERRVLQAFGDRAVILRPGFIVGPDDHTDRFTYWVRRVARGGRFLAPGTPDDPVQWIDVRDLAAFAMHVLEAGSSGVFNLSGPAAPLTWGSFFEQVTECTGSGAVATWVPESFLKLHAVYGPTLPMVVSTEQRGLMTISFERARAAGLRHRAVETTACDTLAWDRQHGTPGSGMSAEREAELLARLAEES